MILVNVVYGYICLLPDSEDKNLSLNLVGCLEETHFIYLQRVKEEVYWNSSSREPYRFHIKWNLSLLLNNNGFPLKYFPSVRSFFW